MEPPEEQSGIEAAEGTEMKPSAEEEVGELDLSLKGGNNNTNNSSSTGNNRPSPTPSPAPFPAGAQLTIFYAGSISVYDAVPPEKAQAIMFIAAAASANNTSTAPTLVGPNAAAASPVLSRSPSLQSSSAAGTAAQPIPQLLSNSNSSLCKLQAELPIARRHSLQRFLEKRRDRLVSRAPYHSTKTSESMEVALEGKPQVS